MARRDKKYTTIALKPETKEQLNEFGEKGNSYEDIVKKLIDKAKKVPDFLE